ncbi:hypothetical protein [Pseudoponticoccus marisrubri]|uniref:Uncharacterized protein n=1 Tax=Pseudoponticoccus marisrubri TaxID=1685382 RepID=A0A0W7WQ69_9RHOB|nr:hypothetical protein [Pseudoponticoccus marisrubri]KUF12754.1 hypothetical protein AVJ23_03325 [Pseudoponticoccus marisrubri]
MTSEFEPRIRFDRDRQIMEADFSGFHFDSSATVNRFYDHIEERIAATGEELWFFLVNLNDMRIDPAAWVAYATRGKALNLAHSMGSVRFDASPETAAQIERAARTEAFDPNLFTNRADALARLAEMPSTRRTRVQHDPCYATGDFVRRIAFDFERGIMEVDFSHFTFNHSRDVNDFYDHIEERIADTGRDRWFFLIDYDGCRILPAAWVQYAHRGKLLNLAHSLGSVRYAPGSETEAEIRLRAESQDFRPNIRNTRAEALARIEEMRLEHA